jgi:hypothetical protein
MPAPVRIAGSCLASGVSTVAFLRQHRQDEAAKAMKLDRLLEAPIYVSRKASQGFGMSGG